MGTRLLHGAVRATFVVAVVLLGVLVAHQAGRHTSGADVEVTGASLDNGLLHIDLVREIPEAMKPRKIAIGGSKAKLVDAKAA